jgi:hypothetical protein
MIIKILFTLVASLGFLFIFWRRLKDDYSSDLIFSIGFYSILGLAVMSVISINFAPRGLYWLSLFGSFAGLVLGTLNFKFRFFESVEAWTGANLFILTILYSYMLLVTRSLASAFLLSLSIFCIILFSFFDKHYKKFVWYKSGRVGFSGLAALGVYFLLRAVIDIFFNDVIFFTYVSDAIISGVLAFISFFTLFNLSKKET